MNKKITRIMAAVLVALMLITAVVPVMSFANAQDDYEAAQAELNKIEKELNSIKDTKKKQQQEKQNTQKQVNLVKSQLASLSKQIEQTTQELAEKQAELDKKKVEIYETDQLFKNKLKAMYIRRSGNVVATALAVDSFSEMLTAVNTLSSISQADTALLKKLDAEKKEIEAVEAEIAAKLTTLENKQDELASLLKKVNSQLSQTEAEEAAAQAAYEDAKKARDAAQEELRKEFAASGGLDGYVGGTWMWPVPGYTSISSGYGYRNIFGYNEFHTGIDIPAGYGVPIKAANSGVVTVASYQSTGYGNRVIVDHGGGYKTLYAHCSSLAIKVGDYVVKGDTIAYIGSTGLSTGNHLHFEIRVNDQYVDPTPYVR